jgi:hypothetical protein
MEDGRNRLRILSLIPGGHTSWSVMRQVLCVFSSECCRKNIAQEIVFLIVDIASNTMLISKHM